MNYYEKYLKYKLKYIQLKSELSLNGGTGNKYADLEQKLGINRIKILFCLLIHKNMTDTEHKKLINFHNRTPDIDNSSVLATATTPAPTQSETVNSSDLPPSTTPAPIQSERIVTVEEKKISLKVIDDMLRVDKARQGKFIILKIDNTPHFSLAPLSRVTSTRDFTNDNYHYTTKDSDKINIDIESEINSDIDRVYNDIVLKSTKKSSNLITSNKCKNIIMKNINYLLHNSNTSNQTVENMIKDAIEYLVTLKNPSDMTNDIYKQYFSDFFGLDTIRPGQYTTFNEIKTFKENIEKQDTIEKQLGELQKNSEEYKKKASEKVAIGRYNQLFDVSKIKQNFIFPFKYAQYTRSRVETLNEGNIKTLDEIIKLILPE
jgi:hypothetical protein